jgi:hypothetical protein
MSDKTDKKPKRFYTKAFNIEYTPIISSAPDRYEAEGILPTNPAQMSRVFKKALEKSKIRKEYNLPKDVPDTNIVRENFKTPEKYKETLSRSHVITKDGGAIPKTYLKDIRENFGIQYTDQDFANMSQQQISSFITDLNKNVGRQNKGEEAAYNFIKEEEKKQVSDEELDFDFVKARETIEKDMLSRGIIPPEQKERTTGETVINNMINAVNPLEMINWFGNKEEKEAHLKKLNKEYQKQQSLVAGTQDATLDTYYNDFASTFAKSYTSGLKAISGFSQWTNGDIKSDPTKQFIFKYAKNLEGKIDKLYSNEGIRESFQRDVVRGAASLTSFLIPGTIAGKLGMTQKFVSGTLGALFNSGDEFERTYEETGSIGKAFVSLFVNAGLGTTEAIPIERMFSGLSKLTGVGLTKRLGKRVLAGWFEEGIQEFGQQLGQEVTSNLLGASNTSPAEVLSNSLYAGLLGGILGVGMNVVGVGGNLASSKYKARGIDKKLSKTDVNNIQELHGIYSRMEEVFPTLLTAEQKRITTVLDTKGIKYTTKEVADAEGNAYTELNIDDADVLENLISTAIKTSEETEKKEKSNEKPKQVSNDKPAEDVKTEKKAEPKSETKTDKPKSVEVKATKKSEEVTTERHRLLRIEETETGMSAKIEEAAKLKEELGNLGKDTKEYKAKEKKIISLAKEYDELEREKTSLLSPSELHKKHKIDPLDRKIADEKEAFKIAKESGNKELQDNITKGLASLLKSRDELIQENKALLKTEQDKIKQEESGQEEKAEVVTEKPAPKEEVKSGEQSYTNVEYDAKNNVVKNTESGSVYYVKSDNKGNHELEFNEKDLSLQIPDIQTLATLFDNPIIEKGKVPVIDKNPVLEKSGDTWKVKTKGTLKNGKSVNKKPVVKKDPVKKSEEKTPKKKQTSKKEVKVDPSGQEVIDEAGIGVGEDMSVEEAHKLADEHIVAAQKEYDEAQKERKDYIQKNGYPEGNDPDFHKLVVKTRDAEDELNKLKKAKDNLLPLPKSEEKAPVEESKDTKVKLENAKDTLSEESKLKTEITEKINKLKADRDKQTKAFDKLKKDSIQKRTAAEKIGVINRKINNLQKKLRPKPAPKPKVVKPKAEKKPYVNKNRKSAEEILSTTERDKLPDFISTAIIDEAMNMKNNLSGSDRMVVNSVVRQDDITGESRGSTPATFSSYPKWFSDLGSNKAAVLKALDKIIEGKGKDKGVVVERVRAIVVDHLVNGQDQWENSGLSIVGGESKRVPESPIPANEEVQAFVESFGDKQITLAEMKKQLKENEKDVGDFFGEMAAQEKKPNVIPKKSEKKETFANDISDVEQSEKELDDLLDDWDKPEISQQKDNTPANAGDLDIKLKSLEQRKSRVEGIIERYKQQGTEKKEVFDFNDDTWQPNMFGDVSKGEQGELGLQETRDLNKERIQRLQQELAILNADIKVTKAKLKSKEVQSSEESDQGKLFQKEINPLAEFVNRIVEITEATNKTKNAFPNVKIYYADSIAMRDIIKSSVEKDTYQKQGYAFENPKAFVDQNTLDVYINLDLADSSSAVHEVAGHVFMRILKVTNPQMWRQGLDLALQDKKLVEYVFNKYPELRKGIKEYNENFTDYSDAFKDELISQAVGNKFSQMFKAEQNPEIRKGLIARFKAWVISVMKNLKLRAKDFYKGNQAIVNKIDSLPDLPTLEQWTEAISSDILEGRVVSKADPKDIIKQSKEAGISLQKADEINKKAKKYFGTTRDIREAGYITANGELLDLSGKNQGGEPGTRSFDHREVTAATDGLADMRDFVDLGNIRFMPESATFDILRPLTPKQEKIVERIIRYYNGDVAIDVQYTKGNYDPDRPIYSPGVSMYSNPGRELGKEFPKGTDPKVVLKEIKDFLDEEIKNSGEQNVSFQKSKDQINSPAFKKWFKDSKVVDKNGDPLVVYHGTDRKFSKFNPKKSIQGLIWFTSDKKGVEEGRVGAAGSGVILDLYASIQNPAGWKEYEKLGIGQIEGLGYDGIILPDSNDGTITGIAFNPNQLKSSTKNNGAYSSEDNRLNFQKDTVPELSPEKLQKATDIVAKFVKVGYHSVQDIADQVLDRGIEGLLPYVQQAYKNYKSTANYSIAIKNSLDNEDTISKFDYRYTGITRDDEQTKIEEERIARGYSDFNTIGTEVYSRRPPIRYADEENLPEVKTEYVVDSQYGNELDEHQRYYVNLAIQSFKNGNKAFVLGDGTGVGKTREILATAEAFTKHVNNKPVLIVTANKTIINQRFKSDAETLGIDPDKYKFATYDDVQSGKIPKEDYGLVLFDEAHALKNSYSKRHRQAKEIKTDHVVYATATPMDRIVSAAYFLSEVSGVTKENIYEMLNIREEMAYDDKGMPYPNAILEEGTEIGDVIDGLIELRNKSIENGAMVRREYAFFGKVDPVTIQKDQDFANEEAFIQNYYAEKIRKVKYIKNITEEEEKRIKMTLGTKRRNELLHITELAKIPEVFRQALEDLKNGRQVVIMVNRVNGTEIESFLKGNVFNATKPGAAEEYVRLFTEAGYDVSRMFGTGKHKVDGLNKFNAGTNKVLIGTYASASTGIDLDDTVGNAPRVMYDTMPSESGDLFQQVLGRVSRRNTKTPAHVKQMYVDGALNDIRRREINEEKLRVLYAIQEGKDADITSILEGYNSVNEGKVGEVSFQKDNKRNKWYNSHGESYSFEDFIDVEVNERENYTKEDVNGWAKKYKIKNSDNVIWVTADKYIANSYNLAAEEYGNRYSIPDKELNVVEIDGEKGFIIPESNDGDEGYLFVYRNLPNVSFQKSGKTLDDLNSNSFKKKLDRAGLIAVHNLTESSLLNAHKIGGLPMPSLAIYDTRNEFTSFGNITLIADKDFITPSGTTKVYSADAYSPRYPSISYRVGYNKIDKIFGDMDKKYEQGINSSIQSDIEDRGFQSFRRNRNVMLHYRDTKNLPVKDAKHKIKQYKEITAEVKKVKLVKDKYSFGSPMDFVNNPIFEKIVSDHYKSVVENSDKEDKEVYADLFFQDGKIKFNFLQQAAIGVKWNLENGNKIDVRETSRKIDEYMLKNKLDNDYENYARDLYDQLDVKEAIFKGFTYSGNRSYIDHNIDNVIKEMKKDKGENFFYGAGSVRASLLRPFKSVEQIINSKDKLVTEKVLAPLKEDMTSGLIEVGDRLKKYYKYDTGAFGYYEEVGQELASFYYNGSMPSFKPIEKEDAEFIRAYLFKLKTAPTEYFEVKVHRAVQFNEFKAAIVPEGIGKETLKILQDSGLEVRTYKKSKNSIKDQRKKVIDKEFGYLSFQKDAMNNVGKSMNFRTEFDNLVEAPVISFQKGDLNSQLVALEKRGITDKWLQELVITNQIQVGQALPKPKKKLPELPQGYKFYTTNTEIKIVDEPTGATVVILDRMYGTIEEVKEMLKEDFFRERGELYIASPLSNEWTELVDRAIVSKKFTVTKESPALSTAIRVEMEAARVQHPERHITPEQIENMVNNPEARRQSLQEYAKLQQEVLDQWVAYLVDQQDYDIPFKYYLLKEVATKSYDTENDKIYKRDNKTLRGITSINRAAISRLHAEYKFDMPLIKAYTMYAQEEAEREAALMTSIATTNDGRWLKFPSKEHDPENFSKNVEILTGIALQSPWCTQHNAHGHLSGGDFYVYVSGEEQKPRVAVRMNGDSMGELKGIKGGSHQQLEDEMIPVADHFLKSQNIPGSEREIESVITNRALVKFFTALDKREYYPGFLDDYDQAKNGNVTDYGNDYKQRIRYGLKQEELTFIENYSVVQYAIEPTDIIGKLGDAYYKNSFNSGLQEITPHTFQIFSYDENSKIEGKEEVKPTSELKRLGVSDEPNLPNVLDKAMIRMARHNEDIRQRIVQLTNEIKQTLKDSDFSDSYSLWSNIMSVYFDDTSSQGNDDLIFYESTGMPVEDYDTLTEEEKADLVTYHYEEEDPYGESIELNFRDEGELEEGWWDAEYEYRLDELRNAEQDEWLEKDLVVLDDEGNPELDDEGKYILDDELVEKEAEDIVNDTMGEFATYVWETTFEDAAGETYTIKISGNSGLGDYSLEIDGKVIGEYGDYKDFDVAESHAIDWLNENVTTNANKWWKAKYDKDISRFMWSASEVVSEGTDEYADMVKSFKKKLKEIVPDLRNEIEARKEFIKNLGAFKDIILSPTTKFIQPEGDTTPKTYIIPKDENRAGNISFQKSDDPKVLSKIDDIIESVKRENLDPLNQQVYDGFVEGTEELIKVSNKFKFQIRENDNKVRLNPDGTNRGVPNNTSYILRNHFLGSGMEQGVLYPHEIFMLIDIIQAARINKTYKKQTMDKNGNPYPNGRWRYEHTIKKVRYSVIFQEDPERNNELYLYNYFTDRDQINNHKIQKPFPSYNTGINGFKSSSYEADNSNLTNLNQNVNTEKILSGLSKEDLDYYNSASDEDKATLLDLYKEDNTSSAASFQKANVGIENFYSPIEKIISGLNQNKFDASNLINKKIVTDKKGNERVVYSGMIGAAPGFKPNELEWIGIEKFLAGKKSVTKDELLEYMYYNKVRIQEVVLGKTGTKKEVNKFGYDEAVRILNEEDENVYWLDANGAEQRVLLSNSSDSKLELAYWDTDTPPNLQTADSRFILEEDVVDTENPNQYGNTKFPSITESGEKENYREFLLVLPKEMIVDKYKLSDQETKGRNDFMDSMRSKYNNYVQWRKGRTNEWKIKTPEGNSSIIYTDGKYIVEYPSKFLRNFYDLQDAKDSVLFKAMTSEEHNVLNSLQTTTDINVNKSYSYKGRGHFPEYADNIFAHIRVSERISKEGKRILFIEEVQSDWNKDLREEGVKVSAAELSELKSKNRKKFLDNAEELQKQLQIDIRYKARNFYYVEETPSGKYRVMDKSDPDFHTPIGLADKTLEDAQARISRFKNIVINKENYGHYYEWLQGDFSTKMQRLKDRALEIEEEKVKLLRGYGVDNFPFANKWVDVALKRIFQIAVAEDFDGIAFVNGEQTAARYRLTTVARKIEYNVKTHDLIVYPKDENKSNQSYKIDPNSKDKKLENYIGSEVAERLLDSPLETAIPYTLKKGEVLSSEGSGEYILYKNNNALFNVNAESKIDALKQIQILSGAANSDWRMLEGEDMNVGGLWAFSLYDKQIPNQVKDYAKKLKGKVESYQIKTVKKDVNDRVVLFEHNGTDIVDPYDDYDGHSISRAGTDPETMFEEAKEYWIRQGVDEHYIQYALEKFDMEQGEDYGDEGDYNTIEQFGLEVTPEFKEKVSSEGLPLFQKSYDKETGDDNSPEADIDAALRRLGLIGESAKATAKLSGEEKSKPKDKKATEKPDNAKVRKFITSVRESDQLEDELKEIVNSQEWIHYNPISNKQTMEEALSWIDEVGFDTVMTELSNLQSLIPFRVKTAAGIFLTKTFSNEGKKLLDQGENDSAYNYFAKANEIVEKLAPVGTHLGQGVQSYAMLGQQTPEHWIYSATKSLSKSQAKEIDELGKTLEIAKKVIRDVNKKVLDDIGKDTLPKHIEGIKKAKEKKLKDDLESAAERLARKIRVEAPRPMNPITFMVNTLFNIAKENGLVPAEKKKTEFNLIEFVGNAVREFQGNYLPVWDQAKELVKEKYAGNEAALKELDEYFEYFLDKPFSEGQIKSITAKAIKELDVKIAEVVKKHYSVSEDTKRTLVDKLIADAGLTPQEAQQLSKAIEKRYDELTTKKKQDLLNQKLKNPLLTKSKKKQQLFEKIIELSNLGALQDSEYAELFAEAFKIKKLSPEDSAKIYAMANDIQTTPEGFQKHDKIIDMLNFIANLEGMQPTEVLWALWYSSILSGLSTSFKNVSYNFVNLTLDSFLRNPKEYAATFSGLLKGLDKGLNEAGQIMKHGKFADNENKLVPTNILERIEFPGGKFDPLNWAKIISRFLIAQDRVFYYTFYESEMSAMSYVLAKQEGLKGKALEKRIAELYGNTPEQIKAATETAEKENLTGAVKKRRILELIDQSRNVESQEFADKYAARGTLNYTPRGFMGNIVKGIQDFQRKPGGKSSKFIIPFTRIVANVTNNALDFTPIGYKRAFFGYTGENKMQGREFTKEIARATFGTLAMYGLYLLISAYDPEDKDADFIITGNGYNDWEKNKQLMETGWRPYSIKFGGRWIKYTDTPLMIPFTLIGSYSDQIRYKKVNLDEKDLIQKVSSAAILSVNAIMSYSFLSGLSNFMQIFDKSNPEKMEDYFAKMGAGLVGAVVPNFVKQINVLFDDSKYDANTTTEMIIRNMGVFNEESLGLRKSVNALGEEMKKDNPYIPVAENRDKVWKMIVDNDAYISMPNQSSVIIFDSSVGEDRAMTQEEYYDYIKNSGKLIKTNINKNFSDLEKLDPADTRDMIADIVSHSRGIIKEQISTKKPLSQEDTTYEFKGTYNRKKINRLIKENDLDFNYKFNKFETETGDIDLDHVEKVFEDQIEKLDEKYTNEATKKLIKAKMKDSYMKIKKFVK